MKQAEVLSPVLTVLSYCCQMFSLANVMSIWVHSTFLFCLSLPVKMVM